MISTIIRIIGWTGTLLFSVRMFPQIYHTYKSKSVAGLSLHFILLDLFAAICFVIYAMTIKAYPMIVCNLIATICDTVLLIMFIEKSKK